MTDTQHVPTYLNGFVGPGRLDTTRDGQHPVRTELRVTAEDVLVSAATLLVYTPHTPRVTCERSTSERDPARTSHALARKESER